jgi:hypothetical protein
LKLLALMGLDGSKARKASGQDLIMATQQPLYSSARIMSNTAIGIGGGQGLQQPPCFYRADKL